MENISWECGKISSRKYTCGYCGSLIASEIGIYGYFSDNRGNDYEGASIHICHQCHQPTYFDSEDNQVPAPMYGNAIEGIKDESLNQLYNETRRCICSNSYTAAILCCRKMLMHIAVDKDADKNQDFKYYVEYLLDKGHIAKNAVDWVDFIRKKGNEANHEILIMKKEDALLLLKFIEILLKTIYELPSTIEKTKSTHEDLDDLPF
jgi:hypothetical protein